jgi:hypothetical protein
VRCFPSPHGGKRTSSNPWRRGLNRSRESVQWHDRRSDQQPDPSPHHPCTPSVAHLVDEVSKWRVMLLYLHRSTLRPSSGLGQRRSVAELPLVRSCGRVAWTRIRMTKDSCVSRRCWQTDASSSSPGSRIPVRRGGEGNTVRTRTPQVRACGCGLVIGDGCPDRRRGAVRSPALDVVRPPRGEGSASRG